MLIIIDALMSWVIPPRSNAVSRVIGAIVDPIVEPFRRLQEKFYRGNMPIDFSPMLAIFALAIIKTIMYNLVR